MYGARSAKRQVAYSNAKGINKLDIGWKKLANPLRTTEKYVDRQGKAKYKGSSSLKSTENLVHILARYQNVLL